MTCINCGNEDTGKLCSNCGQPLEVKRITFREGWSDFWDKMYGFDGQFLRTVRDVTIKPGEVAREFIRGNRVRYFGPIGYYFFMITFFLLVLGMIDISFADYMKAAQVGMPMQDEANTANGEVLRNWFADNMKIIGFLIPLFMAWTAQKIFFRKQNLNFIEHAVPIFYLFGHWYWVSTVEALVLYFTGSPFNATIQFLLVPVYLGYGYTTFITTQPKWKSFLKGVGVYFVGYTFLMILGFIVITIIGIAIAWFNPQFFETLQSPPK